MAVTAAKKTVAKRPAGTSKVVAVLDYKKETSNFIVYEETGKKNVTGSLYFHKDAFGDTAPEQVQIVVTPVAAA